MNKKYNIIKLFFIKQGLMIVNINMKINQIYNLFESIFAL